jgi:excisionase family DNA binding protein
MSVTITLLIGGQPLEAVLDDAALAAIAAAISPTDTTWQEWFNVEDAAAYMDVSPERVRKLIARRAIAFSQEGPGCRVFLRRTDLDTYLNEQRHERKKT